MATSPRAALKLVVMGVSGAGKSTLAAALAERLGCTWIEADDFHPPANRTKMAAGMALNDADREPWLNAIGEAIAAHHDDVVATCSALKRRYRDHLRAAVPELLFICIDITEDEAMGRVATRSPQGFPPSLVATQFASFEAPVDEADVLLVSSRWSTRLQVDTSLQWWRTRP